MDLAIGRIRQAHGGWVPSRSLAEREKQAAAISLHLALQIWHEKYSPELLRKISWAGGNLPSYQQAQQALAEIGDICLQEWQIIRITDRVGRELLSLREREGWLSAPQLPKDIPIASVIAVDGVRVQMRTTSARPGDCYPYWKETKVAQCQLLLAPPYAADLQPDVPKAFLDPTYIQAMVTALKGHSQHTSQVKKTTTTQPTLTEKKTDTPKLRPHSLPEKLPRFAPV